MSNLKMLFSWRLESGVEIVFSPASGYILNVPKGIDALASTVKTEPAVDGYGSIVTMTSVGSRPITLTGHVLSDFPTKKQALVHAFPVRGRGILTASILGDTTSYSIEAYVSGAPEFSRDRAKPKFQISLVAPDPFFWKDALSEQKPTLKPYYIVSVNNRSDVAVPFVFKAKMRGATSVYGLALHLDNSEGRAVKLNRTLAQGQEFTFSTMARPFAATIGYANSIGALDYSKKLIERLPAGMSRYYLTYESAEGETDDVQFETSFSWFEGLGGLAQWL